MKVKFVIACLFVLCLGLLTAASAAQVELINNGSFANGLTGWDSWAGTRTLEGTVLDSNNFAPSAHCAKVTGGYRHIEANNPCVATIVPGMVFHVSGWFYIPALDDGTGATSARLYMRYQIPTGAILLVNDEVEDSTIPVGTWCHKTFDVTPSTPGEMAYLAFGVYGHIGNTRTSIAPTAYFDELSVTVDGYSVSGTVALSDGTSPAGTKVDLLSGTTVVKTVTVGADGAYTFNVFSGSYTVSASKTGYNTSTAVADATSSDVTVPLLTLEKKPVYTIHGKVVDTYTAAVAGAKIFVTTQTDTIDTGVVSGADGTYTVDMYDVLGNCTIYATKAGYSLFSSAGVDIVLGTTSYEVGNIILQKILSHNINGLVTDAATGQPAPNVKLKIDAGDVWGPQYAYTTVTGPDGRYSVDAAAYVPYKVDLDSEPNLFLLTPLEARSQNPDGDGLTADWNNVDLSIVNKLTVTGISGVVKDANTNQPIFNACVQVGGKGGPAAVTDANGKYALTGIDAKYGFGDLYADAVGYEGKLMWVTGQGNLSYDILLTPAAEPYSYNGDMEDLSPDTKPSAWNVTSWSNPQTCVDWSASSTAKTGQKSLFYALNDNATADSAYAGIDKFIDLAPGYDYNFWFSAKADAEVARWQPLVEFQANDGSEWVGFVSNEPDPHHEYAHKPYYEWHTYFNWTDRGSRVGAPVRYRPSPWQTQVHFIFLYEDWHENTGVTVRTDTGTNPPTVYKLPLAGKGCYIDDLVFDAVPQNMTYQVVQGTVIPDVRYGVTNKSALTDAKLVGKNITLWGKIKSIGTTSFVISDGYSTGVTINTSSLPAQDSVEKMCVVTGVLNAQKSVDATAVTVF